MAAVTRTGRRPGLAAGLASAGAAGATVVLLDGRRTSTKAGLMAEIASGLALPAWFGSNWDALVDALRERTPAAGLCLVWDGADIAAGRDADLVGTLADIVEDLAGEGHPVTLVLRSRAAVPA